MSTNCINCVVNRRTGLDLLCDTCRSEKQQFEPTPEVLFFGCLGLPGHFLRSKRKGCYLWLESATPWGVKRLDGGLLPDDREKAQDGKFVFKQMWGWSCVSFWDQSGDERRGSNSAFLVAVEIEAEELFALARTQWPEVFSRPGFPFATAP